MAAPQQITPDRILQQATAFWASKVLLSAVELNVFGALQAHGAEGATGPVLAQEIGMHPRGTYDFLDALVALGYLGRTGDGPDGRYHNAPDAAKYLVPSSPDYIGGALIMVSTRLFKFWHNLPEALRTGQLQNEAKDGGKSMFEAVYEDPARLEVFANSMTGFSKFNFRALADKFDFGRYQTVLDVGGATGELAIALARRHPHLRITTFDLPRVSELAARRLAAEGLADRITAASGDMFTSPLPAAQVLCMGMILHDWNLPKKLELIQRAYDALPADGVFVVIETFIDNERRTSVPGLLMSLNMLIELGDAFDYTPNDLYGWCRQVGFKRFEYLSLAGPGGAVAAYKSA